VYDVVVKRSRSLSHPLMSFSFNLDKLLISSSYMHSLHEMCLFFFCLELGERFGNRLSTETKTTGMSIGYECSLRATISTSSVKASVVIYM